jgi:hypothetical protein
MKSLVCSDIHDNLGSLDIAMHIAETSGCTSVLCCGDLCSPFILDAFNELKSAAFHIVFGNNDGDRFTMQLKSEQLNRNRADQLRIRLHGEYLIADQNHGLAGVPSSTRLALTHYTDLGRAIAASDRFDLVCCGHTHKPFIEKTGSGTLANPGSLMGYVPGPGGGKTKPSCLIMNWETKEIELIEW